MPMLTFDTAANYLYKLLIRHGFAVKLAPGMTSFTGSHR